MTGRVPLSAIPRRHSWLLGNSSKAHVPRLDWSSQLKRRTWVLGCPCPRRVRQLGRVVLGAALARRAALAPCRPRFPRRRVSQLLLLRWRSTIGGQSISANSTRARPLCESATLTRSLTPWRRCTWRSCARTTAGCRSGPSALAPRAPRSGRSWTSGQRRRTSWGGCRSSWQASCPRPRRPRHPRRGRPQLEKSAGAPPQQARCSRGAPSSALRWAARARVRATTSRSCCSIARGTSRRASRTGWRRTRAGWTPFQYTTSCATSCARARTSSRRLRAPTTSTLDCARASTTTTR
ncbi:hypothetical protein T492DRAFT_99169 [Pavlovales sp. CCMP2436]|nr:hypothetical protein T492DRAFT_99169 [Pavlovales sp. CCMP2436]